MTFTAQEVKFLKAMANSRDGRTLTEIFEKMIIEMKDPSKYANKSGTDYESEVKSSVKAAEKLQEFLGYLRPLKLTGDKKTNFITPII